MSNAGHGDHPFGECRRDVRRAAVAMVCDASVPGKAALICLVLLILLLACSAIEYALLVSAERLYQEHRYHDAAKRYALLLEIRPDAPEAKYNMAEALYRARDYAGARAAFRSTLTSYDPVIRSKANVSLGNTEFRLAEQTERTSPDEAIRSYRRSLDHYEAAVLLGKDAGDSKYNREVAERRLDALSRKLLQDSTRSTTDTPREQGSGQPLPQSAGSSTGAGKTDRSATKDMIDGAKGRLPEKHAEGGRSGQEGELSREEAEALVDVYARGEKAALAGRARDRAAVHHKAGRDW